MFSMVLFTYRVKNEILVLLSNWKVNKSIILLGENKLTKTKSTDKKHKWQHPQ
jgi:hypothetical protein